MTQGGEFEKEEPSAAAVPHKPVWSRAGSGYALCSWWREDGTEMLGGGCHTFLTMIQAVLTQRGMARMYPWLVAMAG